MKQKNKLIILSILIILISTLFLTTKALASSFDTSGTSNSEFYYEGTPVTTGSYVSSGNTSEEDCEISAAATVAYQVGKVLTIIQIISVIIAMICLIKGLYNMGRNRLPIDENLENDKEVENNKKPVLGYFCATGVLMGLYGVINIVKNFAAKPIIYIYPEEEKKVSVKLKNPEKLTCSYPRYENEWNVLAKPNGDLIDLKTNRKLYSLYWEGLNTTKSNFNEGFIVEGDNVAKFLEEKLEILGLNERETEEFIVYWLPLMEKNKYNFIRFETIDEINENMGLEINPAPETLIRINMNFKGLRKPIKVEEQKLEKVERKGYTVVEWGGTKL